MIVRCELSAELAQQQAGQLLFLHTSPGLRLLALQPSQKPKCQATRIALMTQHMRINILDTLHWVLALDLVLDQMLPAKA
jgi:hypothetical protein